MTTSKEKIVAFGDSNTFGQGIDPEKRWTSLLAAIRDANVINAGVCGDQTRLALERFPCDVQEQRPISWLIISFGMNDANRWETDRDMFRVSPAAFKANLIEMHDRAIAFSVPQEQIIYCTITLSDKRPLLSHDTAEYSKIIRRVARETGCHLFDAEQIVPLSLWDHVHLDEAGHQAYAHGLQETMSC